MHLRRRSLFATVATVVTGSAVLAGTPQVAAATAVAVEPEVLHDHPVPSSMAPALFIGAHPDDLELMAAVPIAEHVIAGQDIHVLLITDGEASGVINVLNGTASSAYLGYAHVPADENYPPLTVEQFSAARVQETRTALRVLTAGMPTGRLTLHRAQLADGFGTQLGADAARDAAYAAILDVCEQIAPGGAVRLKGHTDVIDNHADHIAVGRAIRKLVTTLPARFSDGGHGARYYIEQPYWADSRLAKVVESWDTPTDSKIKARAIAAYRSYAAWAPSLGAYAIGAHSVPGQWTTLIASPKSLQHS